MLDVACRPAMITPENGNIRDSPILRRSALHEGAAEESNTWDYNKPWMLGYPWLDDQI